MSNSISDQIRTMGISGIEVLGNDRVWTGTPGSHYSSRRAYVRVVRVCPNTKPSYDIEVTAKNGGAHRDDVLVLSVVDPTGYLATHQVFGGVGPKIVLNDFVHLRAAITEVVEWIEMQGLPPQELADEIRSTIGESIRALIS